MLSITMQFLSNKFGSFFKTFWSQHHVSLTIFCFYIYSFCTNISIWRICFIGWFETDEERKNIRFFNILLLVIIDRLLFNIIGQSYLNGKSMWFCPFSNSISKQILDPFFNFIITFTFIRIVFEFNLDICAMIPNLLLICNSISIIFILTYRYNGFIIINIINL